MSALTEYNPTEAALAELRQRYADVAFDLTTTKGDKEARAARKELVTLRTSLEAKRKELKAPALERAKLIDTEAKRIEAAILELEAPIDAQIKADETRRERERQEKAEREAKRVAGLQSRVDAIRAIPVKSVGVSTDELRKTIQALEQTEIGEDFEEFLPLARRAQADALESLRTMLAAAEAAEAEAKRLAEERAELERQRAEAARIAGEIEEGRRAAEAAAAEQRRQQEAEAAAARAKIEAEQREARERIERQEREAREAREKADAEARAQRAAEEERLRKEREALEAARREQEAQEAAARRQREEAEAQARREQEEREAEARRVEEERQRVEREAAEAAQRERDRLLRGREILQAFVVAYATDPEFAAIVPAIRAFLGPAMKEAA